MRNKQTGQLGENIAKELLVKKGYKIIQRNYHARVGEIDIIAEKNSELIFIEVKTRTSDSFGTPEESLTRSKIQKLIKASLHFMHHANQITFTNWRIDLIAVKLHRNHQLKEINHLKNILNG